MEGWSVLGSYTDGGVSGALASRPALDEVVRLVEDGQVDLVAITKLDRIARSLRHLLDLLELFERHSVTLVALDDPIDPATASGRAMVQLRGVFAELERQLIRERMIEGMERRADQGGWLGGPPPYGFTIVPNPAGGGTKLAIDEDEAAVVRLAFDLLVERGATTQEAAEELNRLGTVPRQAARWSHWNLRRLLLDGRGLSGRWPWRRAGREQRDPRDEVIIEIPAILTLDEHERLLATLAKTSTQPTKQRSYLLSARIQSPHGTTMQGVPGRGDKRWYRCPHRLVALAPGGVKCDCGRLHADTVEFAVWEQVTDILANPGALEALAQSYDDTRAPQAKREREHLTKLDREIQALEQTIGEQAAGLAAEGLDPGAVAATVRVLNDKLTARKTERADLLRLRERNLASATLVQRLRGLAQRAAYGLEAADDYSRKRILDLLDLQVQIQSWERCDTCGGRGLLAYPDVGRKRRRNVGPDNRQRRPLICPDCLRTRWIPRLAIRGTVPEALLLAIAERDLSAVSMAPTGAQLPFHTDVRIA